MIEERTDPYPFAYLAAFVWLPLTAWLVWIQLRARTLWIGAVAFSISMFVLLYLGRVLQNSYLVWPLAGIGMAYLLAAARAATSPGTSARSAESHGERRRTRSDVARHVEPRHRQLVAPRRQGRRRPRVRTMRACPRSASADEHDADALDVEHRLRGLAEAVADGDALGPAPPTPAAR